MLNSYYVTPLVLASVVVAIFASYAALSLAGRVAQASARHARWWIMGGAFAMGIGIWSMHFIGMLAFRLPIAVGYDFGITLLSLMLGVVASGLALWQVSHPEMPGRRLAAGALLMGAGINAMHYTGMAAMRMEPGIDYDPLLFAASVLVAVAASGAALWMAFRLRRDAPNLWAWRAGAAVLMGCAIVGMHYTGMAAANFPAGSVCLSAQGGFSLDGLAMMVIIGTLGVLAIAMMASVFDARLEASTRHLVASQATLAARHVQLGQEREARAEAERMSAVKDEFLATLSHELRTPLNAILGWSQLLRSAPAEAATLSRGLDTIERNALAQAKLIDDLLDMSQIMSGKVRLDSRPLHPSAFIEAALETVRPTAMPKGVRFEASLDPRAGVIFGDPDRLQQVLWNLLFNAVKFSPQGSTVRVAMTGSEHEVVIEVRDQGIGIAPEFLPHVFDRFRQADSSTTRRFGGLGLGLAIVRQLVELHGGSVEVSSAGVGQGACFTVRLPLYVSEPARPSGHQEIAETKTITLPFVPVDLSGRCALIVDDESDALDVLEVVLQRCGALVVRATDAIGALAALDAHEVDVLISDIGMADIDGFELIRRVRALPGERGAVPALALTAFTRAEDQRRALMTGYSSYLPKPLDPSSLVRLVASLTPRREPKSAAAAAQTLPG